MAETFMKMQFNTSAEFEDFKKYLKAKLSSREIRKIEKITSDFTLYEILQNVN